MCRTGQVWYDDDDKTMQVESGVYVEHTCYKGNAIDVPTPSCNSYLDAGNSNSARMLVKVDGAFDSALEDEIFSIFN